MSPPRSFSFQSGVPNREVIKRTVSNNRDATEERVDSRAGAFFTVSPDDAATKQDAGAAILRVSVGQSPRPIPDDLELIRLAQQGDGDAFAQLYDRYLDRIYRYILFRVSDDLLAEDITAHVFLKMWEKLPRYQIGKTPICGWLYRIAHNAVVDHYRTRKLSVSLDDVNSAEVRHDDGTEEKLELQVKLDQLRMALQNLTDGQREVLILRFIEGLSVEKVARQLRKSHGAVRALQMRGLQELSKAPTLRTDR